MRRYSVRVNGTVYTLDVEETALDQFTVKLEDGRLVDVGLDDDQDLAQALISPSLEGSPRRTPTVSATPRTATPPRSPVPASAVNTSGSPSPVGSVTAPLPGVVLSVAVSPGTAVTRGDTLLTLEAMKMKNEIRSQRDGVVATVHVQAGDQVKHGDPLISFEG